MFSTTWFKVLNMMFEAKPLKCDLNSGSFYQKHTGTNRLMI